MKVDTVITLASGREYLLLLEESYGNDNYFLSVLLDDKKEPTDEYVVLKEIEKDGETRVAREKNPVILQQLFDDYSAQYESEYSNNE